MHRNAPRKQRTRQHVIADLSVHRVEGFILEAGHTAQRFNADYGYDLALYTYDEQGYAEPGILFMQVKAAEELRTVGADRVFDVDIRDFNLWMLEKIPVVLILFDASRGVAYWLAFQRYFWEDESREPKTGARTVRVKVPKTQVMNREAVGEMRKLKRELRVSLGVIP